jgi:hypothetical protein
MSVKEASEKMGVSPQFVRVGLQRGVLPFGVAVKLSSRWTYYINPKQFNEYMRIRVENENERHPESCRKEV